MEVTNKTLSASLPLLSSPAPELCQSEADTDTEILWPSLSVCQISLSSLAHMPGDMMIMFDHNDVESQLVTQTLIYILISSFMHVFGEGLSNSVKKILLQHIG